MYLDLDSNPLQKNQWWQLLEAEGELVNGII